MASLSAHAQSTPPWGDGRSKPEDLYIHLVTFGPGGGMDVPSYFGHNAVIVEDTRWRSSRVYNYGMFDFGPDLLPKFLMGRLQFWVGETPTAATLRAYQDDNRSVRIQTLDLPDDKELELAKFFADNVLPENRYYLYHHYFDNCATRVRDAIDDITDGQLKEATSQPARLSLRGHTRRLTHQLVPLELLLMFWMNDEIDQPIQVWDEMFLPEELERVMSTFEYTDEDGVRRRLVAKTTVVFEADREPPPEKPAVLWPFTLLFGLLFGGGAAALGYIRSQPTNGSTALRVLFGGLNLLAGLLIGVPALMLFLMSSFTEHTVTYWNENLLLANPITFVAAVLAPFIMFGKRWASRAMAYGWYALAITGLLAVLLKVLPAFDQDNLLSITMILPMNLGFAAAFWLQHREK